ncbi:MAG: hypothetical protein GYB65_07295 [Chloroflexi bacterium]|nr:hypothetical protein [Chloroflexota bacterium]
MFPRQQSHKKPVTDSPPGWVWWGTLVGVGSVLLVVMGGAWWLGQGGADPSVAGTLSWEDMRFDWAQGPQQELAPGAGMWYTAGAVPLLPGDFTLTVQARLTPGSDPGAAWGVWVELEDGARVLYAISGDGYVTTRRCDFPLLAEIEGEIERCPAQRPEWRWMPYNRLHGPGFANRVTLHRETQDSVRLRLNDERLGLARLDLSGRWGLWWRGGRETAAILIWERAALYDGSY